MIPCLAPAYAARSTVHWATRRSLCESEFHHGYCWRMSRRRAAQATDACVQLIDDSGDSEACCPRCSSRISPGVLARLPRHKKLCTLVLLLTTYQTVPEHLTVEESPENTVDHDGGHPVYAGKHPELFLDACTANLLQRICCNAQTDGRCGLLSHHSLRDSNYLIAVGLD